MPIEWAIRSSALIVIAALILKLLRIKNPVTGLAAWTATLFGSLSIPAIMSIPAPAHLATVPALRIPAAAEFPDLAALPHPFNWVVFVYLVVTVILVLRLITGLAMSEGLRRTSRPAGKDFRESEAITAPIAVGILRPEIIVPADWREWEQQKLEAIVAHERSHVARHDPAIQAISALHRAMLWFSPLAWYLHSRLVRLAEQASDDAALVGTSDRAFYADILLGFVEQSAGKPRWQGQAMARYGKAEDRIQRILDGEVLPRPVTKRAAAAIVLAALPLTYLAGQVRSLPKPEPKLTAQAPSGPTFHLGSVKARTVIIKPPVEGQLKSINFAEGEMVKQGQVLAIIDTGQTAVEVCSPLAGLAGLRMIDPGNMITRGDAIVVIAQLEPISVVFTAPEDHISEFRALVQSGATVEAWNRDFSQHLATGKLVGVDNTIDEQSGTARLKAIFENRDGSLFPNQFINVRVIH